MLKYLTIAALCFCGGGCSSLQLQRPTAAVTGMTLREVNAKGFTMAFDVRVENPNKVPLPLASADYKLGLAGTQVLDGSAKPGGSLPAQGSQTVVLPVTLNFASVLEASQRLRGAPGDVPYNLEGGLSFDTGVPLMGQLRVPLQYGGTLHLREILNGTAPGEGDAIRLLRGLISK